MLLALALGFPEFAIGTWPNLVLFAAIALTMFAWRRRDGCNSDEVRMRARSRSRAGTHVGFAQLQIPLCRDAASIDADGNYFDEGTTAVTALVGVSGGTRLGDSMDGDFADADVAASMTRYADDAEGPPSDDEYDEAATILRVPSIRRPVSIPLQVTPDALSSADMISPKSTLVDGIGGVSIVTPSGDEDDFSADGGRFGSSVNSRVKLTPSVTQKRQVSFASFAPPNLHKPSADAAKAHNGAISPAAQESTAADSTTPAIATSSAMHVDSEMPEFVLEATITHVRHTKFVVCVTEVWHSHAARVALN